MRKFSFMPGCRNAIRALITFLYESIPSAAAVL